MFDGKPDRSKQTAYVYTFTTIYYGEELLVFLEPGFSAFEPLPEFLIFTVQPSKKKYDGNVCKICRMPLYLEIRKIKTQYLSHM